MAGTNYNAEINANVDISLTDDFNHATTAECTGDPNVVAMDSDVFTNGCIMRRTDVGTGNVLYENQGTLSSPSWILLGGGSGTPHLPDKSIQYNNAGVFWGDSEATRDPTTHQTNIAATRLSYLGIVYTIVSGGPFFVNQNITDTTPPGGTAFIINLTATPGTMYVGQTGGTFNIGDTITGPGTVATITGLTFSTLSAGVLIGDLPFLGPNVGSVHGMTDLTTNEVAVSGVTDPFNSGLSTLQAWNDGLNDLHSFSINDRFGVLAEANTANGAGLVADFIMSPLFGGGIALDYTDNVTFESVVGLTAVGANLGGNGSHTGDVALQISYTNNAAAFVARTALGISPLIYTAIGTEVLNDMNRSIGYTGVSNAYTVTIDGNGAPDTFTWTDGITTVNNVSITGVAQTLSHGITITFSHTTGHTIGDKWDFAFQANSNQIGPTIDFFHHQFIWGYANSVAQGTNLTVHDDTRSVEVHGTLQLPIRVSSADFNETLGGGDNTIVMLPTTQDVTVLLPPNPQTGWVFTVKKGNNIGHNVIVDGNGNTIEGVSTKTIVSIFGWLQVIWNGTQWNVLGQL